MNTTIDLSDSSIDCSVVIEDTASLKDPDKKRATKNGRKKVSGIKLDDTVDLISSSDDESKDEQNNFQTTADDRAFVTAGEATLHNDSVSNVVNYDKTSYGTPHSQSFMPSVSSTSTPAVPVPYLHSDDENNGDEISSLTEEVNITVNESILANYVDNDLLVSNDVTGRCYEVEDEFLNSSTSTVGGDAKNDIEDTPTQTFTEGDVAEDKVPSDVDTSIKDSTTDKIVDKSDIADKNTDANEPSTPSSEHSSLTATTDDEEEDIDERSSQLMSLPSKRRRIMEPDLPATCTILVSNKTGGRVYLVGTAHFSKESQDDVARVIRAVQPDAVVLELCKARINILHTDEAKVQEEAQNLTVDKMLATLRQNGVVQGTMYLFLLYFSARLTKELGMAPGGEFRRAFLEARNVPGCIIQLGDRPIEVTLKRAFTTLSLWQKIKFGYSILTFKDSITAEEVEQCKQKDLLESMLEEIAGEFPALSRVFVQERDLFLAHSLRIAVDSPVKFVPEQSTPHHMVTNEAPVVVGVVGIGHVSGIIANWDSVTPAEVGKLMIIPKTSLAERVAYMTLRATVLGLGLYTCYRVVKIPVSLVKSRFF